MQNKKGIVGSFSVNYIATIVIIVILVLFLLGAGVVKTFSERQGDAVILDESDVGVQEVIDYVGDEFNFHVLERISLGGADHEK